MADWEYLVRGDDGEPDLGLTFDRMAAVLTPHGWNAVPVAGWGSLRLQLDEVEIAFSDEAGFGWQINFEGNIDEGRARAFVDAVALQLRDELSRPVEVVDL